jgi:zinc/manganese transport system substrate-binding protein
MLIRIVFLSVLLSTWSYAGILKTVASTTSAEMLLREIGGDAVTITTLAPADRDVHTLAAKPSMMFALRNADLVVSVGAELEVGWLPLAIESSANPRILPNQLGYFEMAAQIDLLDAKGVIAADRSKGDVHPMGNPHVQLDPVRMQKIATALAKRLSVLDEKNADKFKQRAQKMNEKLQAQIEIWQTRSKKSSGVLLYHKDMDYFMKRFSIPVLAYIEVLPGVPPTASHLQMLMTNFKGKQGAIISTPYQNNAAVTQLSKQLNWRYSAVPIDPQKGATLDSYIALLNQLMDATLSVSP